MTKDKASSVDIGDEGQKDETEAGQQDEVEATPDRWDDPPSHPHASGFNPDYWPKY